MCVEQATGSAGRWVVTVTGMVASFSMVLSATIVNVAVPDVMGAFGVGQGLAQFLATAYLATMTASQLLGRWITGWLGRRVAFMTVLVVFAAGGLLCAESVHRLSDPRAGDAGFLGRNRSAARADAYQDGFVLVTCVFVLALVPTWLIGWLDRRRRIG